MNESTLRIINHKMVVFLIVLIINEVIIMVYTTWVYIYFFFLFARHNTWQIVDNKCLLNERVCTMVMLLTILMDLCSQWFFYKCWRSFVSLIKWDLPYAALGLLLFSPLYHVNWSLLETNPHPCAVSEQYVLAEKITPQWLKRKGK